MDREKQIEEMAQIVTSSEPYDVCKGQSCLTCEFVDIGKDCFCAKAHNAGYSKRSEVAREIFEEIEILCERYKYF